MHAHAVTSWPPEFSNKLRAAIDRHLGGPQDDHAAGFELQQLLQRHPDTGRLARDQAPFTCAAPLAAA
ncbi:hypothetical protein DQ384_40040 [Sphaerisporangium album]|uniref:Uncharacterized protein n=1 Tax=Sphaerisporangium album TaxID=509200 RepID=A0A367EGP6_9ACTN|nr:hypothetical protein DQ384_40040 [Sphaerisporangium album]